MGFRAVNEGCKQSYGVVDPQSEAVHLFRGDVDVDRSIVDLQGPEARASQSAAPGSETSPSQSGIKAPSRVQPCSITP